MKNLKQTALAFMLTLGFVFFLTKHSQAQVDTTTKKDTTVIPKDTTVVPKDTTATPVSTSTQTTESAPAEKPKGKSTFIIYAGPNISTLRVESEELNKESK